MSDGRWEVRHTRPIAYQESQGEKIPVSAATQAVRDGAISIEIGEYEVGRSLTIDPVISVSRVIGGWADTRIHQLKSAPDGSLYAYGETLSSDSPGVDSGVITNAGQNQSVVFKLDPVSLALKFAVPIGWRSAQQAPTLARSRRQHDNDRGERHGCSTDHASADGHQQHDKAVPGPARA